MQGKVLTGKESKKNDWKQWISKGIQDTSEALKTHANRMRNWWGAKKDSFCFTAKRDNEENIGESYALQHHASFTPKRDNQKT